MEAAVQPNPDPIEPLSSEQPDLETSAVADPTATPEEESAAAADASHLPVPVEVPAEKQRTSLWRRIALRRSPAASDSVTNDVLRTRLDGIALRLEAIDRSIAASDERLDERLARLWEVEEQLEQLSDLSERTVEARDAALEAAGAARGLARSVNVIAVVLGLAVTGGAAVLALPYLQ